MNSFIKKDMKLTKNKNPTSFNELIKLHFTLSSPSQGINMFPGYPVKCTCTKNQKLTSNPQMCIVRKGDRSRA